MIKITQTKSKLQANLENIDEPLDLVVNAVRSAVHNLNQSFERFWKLSDPEIEEILNYHGPEEIEKIFTAHHTYGAAFNKLLEDRGISEPRAVLVKPREITMNESGQMILVPLPEPEQPEVEEPTPDPAPDSV